MDNLRHPGVDRCANCGWPLHAPYETVSCHSVTEGTVVYSRCACGTLRVWLQRPGAGDRLLIGARRTRRDGTGTSSDGPGG
ncbi:hypothetical protein ITI46_19575 [Streptomyces oryzae]|uniref:Uncharacterized protein n=1 Tax=Streptomyces oryzae TaxID=1434886 RepID=A0ABS3XEL9_9ACTN|nr:hypothetical protein [Streptomyces oryzae]MBO8193845.1 hypothetical protein [Streptomyces oryzae]